jgi:hypothetical protein
MTMEERAALHERLLTARWGPPEGPEPVRCCLWCDAVLADAWMALCEPCCVSAGQTAPRSAWNWMPGPVLLERDEDDAGVRVADAALVAA